MNTRSITRLLSGGALALAVSGLAITPAIAAEENQTRTTGVTHTDLDLSTAEGQEELDRRIDEAAKQVCGYGDVQVGSRATSREARQCYREARRQLDRQFAQIVNNASRGG